MDDMRRSLWERCSDGWELTGMAPAGGNASCREICVLTKGFPVCELPSHLQLCGVIGPPTFSTTLYGGVICWIEASLSCTHLKSGWVFLYRMNYCVWLLLQQVDEPWTSEAAECWNHSHKTDGSVTSPVDSALLLGSAGYFGFAQAIILPAHVLRRHAQSLETWVAVWF